MAAERIAVNATDPSVDGALLAYHQGGAPGVLVRGGQASSLPGTHPALGGARVAVLANGSIGIQQTSGAPFSLTVPAPGADAVAVSASWVAWRARGPQGDTIFAAPLAGGPPRRVAQSAELGRPALEGGRLAYHVTGRTGGRIVIADLATGKRSTVRRERRALLLNPSLHGGQLAYVRTVYRRQELRVGPQSRRRPQRDARLWSTVPTGRRDAGHEPGKKHDRHGWPRKLWARPAEGLSATLWTTALAADVAYVALLRQVAGQALEAVILRVPRQPAG
jgi:hypothetical protein